MAREVRHARAARMCRKRASGDVGRCWAMLGDVGRGAGQDCRQHGRRRWEAALGVAARGAAWGSTVRRGVGRRCRVQSRAMGCQVGCQVGCGGCPVGCGARLSDHRRRCGRRNPVRLLPNPRDRQLRRREARQS
eukprot:6468056-Prymnesium_polylepis.1